MTNRLVVVGVALFASTPSAQAQSAADACEKTAGFRFRNEENHLLQTGCKPFSEVVASVQVGPKKGVVEYWESPAPDPDQALESTFPSKEPASRAGDNHPILGTDVHSGRLWGRTYKIDGGLRLKRAGIIEKPGHKPWLRVWQYTVLDARDDINSMWDFSISAPSDCLDESERAAIKSRVSTPPANTTRAASSAEAREVASPGGPSAPTCDRLDATRPVHQTFTLAGGKTYSFLISGHDEYAVSHLSLKTEAGDPISVGDIEGAHKVFAAKVQVEPGHSLTVELNVESTSLYEHQLCTVITAH